MQHPEVFAKGAVKNILSGSPSLWVYKGNVATISWIFSTFLPKWAFVSSSSIWSLSYFLVFFTLTLPARIHSREACPDWKSFTRKYQRGHCVSNTDGPNRRWRLFCTEVSLYLFMLPMLPFKAIHVALRYRPSGGYTKISCFIPTPNIIHLGQPTLSNRFGIIFTSSVRSKYLCIVS